MSAAHEIGNVSHPKTMKICLCCGRGIEGKGYTVRYAPDAPPDFYCSKQHFDAHEQQLCRCFWN